MMALVLADAYLTQQAVKRANYSLEELREQIDVIDAQLAALIAERMKISKEIGKLKHKNDAQIEDPKREAEVVKNWKKYAAIYKESKESAENIVKTIIAECKKKQTKR